MSNTYEKGKDCINFCSLKEEAKESRMNIAPDATWRDLPKGGYILQAGNAKEFKTGDWRSMKPVWHEDKCKHCLFCWAVCPDMSIIVENNKVVKFDFDHCKGCGVCTKQCKFGALDFVPEE